MCTCHVKPTLISRLLINCRDFSFYADFVMLSQRELDCVTKSVEESRTAVRVLLGGGRWKWSFRVTHLDCSINDVDSIDLVTA